MKRTSLALLTSLGLHAFLMVAVYGWMDEKPASKSESISFRMNSVSIYKKEQNPINEMANQESSVTPQNEIKPQKIPSKKREKISSKTVPSVDETNIISESNATSLTENVSPKPNTTVSFEPESTKQTYVELYGNEIRALIEKYKEYPELARKRSLGDTVEVSFILTPSGEIEALQAPSKYKILSNSAVETLHKAKVFFPLPSENVTIKIPIIYLIK
ncbi:TonB family protein [Sulfurospirillum arsenophilum]|uniref:TonB family protein n=1 Tax=Sulfurospirillum arsenophilum TaxID=56698 RepID=UPI0005A70B5C|nr:TonB family protein [Sulfurospirillum arsenophilum]